MNHQKAKKKKRVSLESAKDLDRPLEKRDRVIGRGRSGPCPSGGGGKQVSPTPIMGGKGDISYMIWSG